MPSNEEREQYAKSALRIFCEAVSEILPDEQNAIKRYHQNKNKTVIDGIIKELEKGNSPTIYADTSGIVRLNYWKGEILLIDGLNSPSKIKGKTVKDAWNIVKTKYNSKLNPIMKKLSIE